MRRDAVPDLVRDQVRPGGEEPAGLFWHGKWVFEKIRDIDLTRR